MSSQNLFHRLYLAIPKQLWSGLILALAGLILYRQIIPLSIQIRDFPLNDFSVYRDGVTATLEGKNPYQLWFFDRYNYSPAATLLFWPVTLLPLNLAEYVFTGISILALWLTLTYILESLEVKLSWSVKILLFTLSLKLFPVKLTLSLGQINLVILALIIGSFFSYQQKNSSQAGILLGLATLLKLTPAPLVFFFALKNDSRAVIWWGTTLVVFVALGAFVFGLPLTQHYYTQLIPQLAAETTKLTVKTDYMNQGLTAFLGRWDIFGPVNALVRYTVSAASFAWVSFKLLKTKNPFGELKLFSLMVIVVMLLLPIFVWQHHFVYLIPAWLLLAITSFKQPKSWVGLAAISSYVLLNLYFRDPSLPMQQHPLVASHFLAIALLMAAATWLAPTPSRLGD